MVGSSGRSLVLIKAVDRSRKTRSHAVAIYGTYDTALRASKVKDASTPFRRDVEQCYISYGFSVSNSISVSYFV